MNNKFGLNLKIILPIFFVLVIIFVLVSFNYENKNQISCTAKIVNDNPTNAKVKLQVSTTGENAKIRDEFGRIVENDFYETEVSDNGIYIFEAVSSKKISSCSVEVSNIDVKKPSVILNFKKQNKSEGILVISASDNIALAEDPYSWDGNAWTSNPEKKVTRNGNYTVYVRDSASNIETVTYRVSNIGTTVMTNSLATYVNKKETLTTNEPIKSWQSSNSAIVAVDKNGIITAYKVGTAKITAIATSGQKYLWEVTVKEPVVSKISLNSKTAIIKVGNTHKLTIATIEPTNATCKKITWTSSNENAATVNNGIVTGVAPGNAMIVASCDDVKASSNIIVEPYETNIPIKVTKITLNKTSMTLEVGKTDKLSVSKIEPTGATCSTITWATSNKSVATVNNGVVTGLSAGSVTITATCDGIKASANITIKKSENKVETFTISMTSNTSQTLNAKSSVKEWKTNDANVVSVDEKGKVTAKVAGTATVTAFLTNGDQNIWVITVVRPKVTKITLNKTSATIDAGKTETLSVSKIEPTGSACSTITWSTSNKSVATVNNGVVTGVASGTATITATCDGIKATAAITITKPKVTKITLNKTSATIEVGKTDTLSVSKIEPTGATCSTVTWSTSNKSVATVNNGVVTGVKAGTATITATCDGIKATATITVKNKPTITKLELNETIKILGLNEKYKLSLKEGNCTNASWSSTNTDVATVSAGEVTTKNLGITTIKLNCDGKTATSTIFVKSSSPKKSYESSSLKLLLQNQKCKNNASGCYVSYIWMENPGTQIKKLDPSVARFAANGVYAITDADADAKLTELNTNRRFMNVKQMLDEYVSKNLIGKNKTAIAYNASGGYFSNVKPSGSTYYDYNMRSTSWFVITNGLVTRNVQDDETGHSAMIGITKTGEMRYYGTAVKASDRANLANRIINDKVQNTFSWQHLLVKNGVDVYEYNESDIAYRQGICQYDDHTYIMITSNNAKFNLNDFAEYMVSLGCKIGFNLDGGGSTSLVYKSNTSSTGSVLRCHHAAYNACRAIPEGIYFTEK